MDQMTVYFEILNRRTAWEVRERERERKRERERRVGEKGIFYVFGR